MTTPESNADQRRRQVLEAALAAIAEVGADRVRMTDIARRAGMTPGHILYYFERKDRILAETLRLSEEDLAVERPAILARTRTQRRRLQRFVELYLPTGRDDVRWNLWAQLLVRPPGDTETAQLLDQLNDLWRDDLTELLDGDRERALRLCYLMDGLAWDMATGGITRAQAVRLACAQVDAEQVR